MFYITILEIARFLNKRFESNCIHIISKLLLYPIIAFKLILDIAKPTIYILVSYLYIIIIAFALPFLILKAFDELFCWSLNIETLIFIVFALGSILCVHKSKLIHFLIYSWSPLNNEKHKFQQLGKDLSKYVLQPQNLSFILYLLYFIYLVISSYIYLQYKKFLISKEIDEAILKAFLVFIACTNMITKSRDVDMQAKVLLQKMFCLIIAQDDNLKD